jgi:uncharacterized protein with GYD domain
MPKYLFKASLTAAGLDGTIREGGTSRREAIEDVAKGLGGTVEAFYYAFGDTDVFLIADLADNETAAAIAMAVTASGAASVSTTVLLTPEEIDAATRKTVDYRPPGA